MGEVLGQAWSLLKESSVYMLFGLLVGGLLKVYLSPEGVARHLGQGRSGPVFKAALLGAPLPLCSCGVLPAAASLKKQGANNGAVSSFLIATPETGVDSLAVTYALLGPLMTVARPLAAILSAVLTGLAQNILEPPEKQPRTSSGLVMACAPAACCAGHERPAPAPRLGPGLLQALNHARGELWGEMAPWFLAGLLLTGLITVLIPEDFFANYLGGGLSSMLIMLAVGIPIYICASASTPIAAALILKGVSPGAALVFLLAGPATNLTSLTVLWNLMGKKATAIYLTGLALSALVCGLALDQVCAMMGWQPAAMLGQASELLPEWAQLGGAWLLLILSIPSLWGILRGWLGGKPAADPDQPCGCAPG